jgi:hypothetical protein
MDGYFSVFSSLSNILVACLVGWLSISIPTYHNFEKMKFLWDSFYLPRVISLAFSLLFLLLQKTVGFGFVDRKLSLLKYIADASYIRALTRDCLC